MNKYRVKTFKYPDELQNFLNAVGDINIISITECGYAWSAIHYRRYTLVYTVEEK